MHPPTHRDIFTYVYNSHQLSSNKMYSMLFFSLSFSLVLPFGPLLFRNIFGFCVVCRVFIQQYVCAWQKMGIQAVTTHHCTAIPFSLFLSSYIQIYTIIVALDLLRTAFPPKKLSVRAGFDWFDWYDYPFQCRHFSFFDSFLFFSLHIYCCIQVCSHCLCPLLVASSSFSSTSLTSLLSSRSGFLPSSLVCF